MYIYIYIYFNDRQTSGKMLEEILKIKPNDEQSKKIDK
jgi:hypothetical protein